MRHTILTTEPETGYELIDSGDGEKLERYGDVILRRPDPQALWRKADSSLWEKADGVFVRSAKSASWKMRAGIPEEWQISFSGLRFVISPTAFKHTGVFPEQASNWAWIDETVRARVNSGRPVAVLNLFGYTGGATLAAARAGAEVTHVDGSKAAIAWAKDNARASGLENAPIRWMLDDVRKFVAREIKRGKRYDGIIMDPPAFGHGAKKELWKIEEDLPLLLDMCRQVLSDNALFFLINGYSAGYSAITYSNNLESALNLSGGESERGELTLRESAGGRLLPCGIFARWRSQSV